MFYRILCLGLSPVVKVPHHRSRVLSSVSELVSMKQPLTHLQPFLPKIRALILAERWTSYNETRRLLIRCSGNSDFCRSGISDFLRDLGFFQLISPGSRIFGSDCPGSRICSGISDLLRELGFYRNPGHGFPGSRISRIPGRSNFWGSLSGISDFQESRVVAVRDLGFSGFLVAALFGAHWGAHADHFTF